jgi:glycosyltransferase involved in cell wall biosynthesis
VTPPEYEAGETGEQDAPINAIWVGHHVDVKRVDRLLQAFAIAHRRQPRLRLTLLGDGPLREPTQELARALKVESSVRFLPAMSRAGVRDQMARSDFLVISSETETFGVVGIEALSMGLPVLATACGGPCDFIRHRGVGELVGNTAEDLAIGMQRMVDRSAEFDSTVIRQYAIDNFDYARVGRQLALAYQALLQPERGTCVMTSVGGTE